MGVPGPVVCSGVKTSAQFHGDPGLDAGDRETRKKERLVEGNGPVGLNLTEPLRECPVGQCYTLLGACKLVLLPCHYLPGRHFAGFQEGATLRQL